MPSLTTKDIIADLKVSRSTLYTIRWVMDLRRGLKVPDQPPYRWDADEYYAAKRKHFTDNI